MAPTDDGLTPKFGHTSYLDAKTFILGQGNVIRKERIQEFFNCVGNLSLDDAPILKTTRSYADAISALVTTSLLQSMVALTVFKKGLPNIMGQKLSCGEPRTRKSAGYLVFPHKT